MENHQSSDKGTVGKPLRNHEQRQIAQVFMYQFGQIIDATGPEQQAHHNAGRRYRNSGPEKTTHENIGEKVLKIFMTLPKHNAMTD